LLLARRTFTFTVRCRSVALYVTRGWLRLLRLERGWLHVTPLLFTFARYGRLVYTWPVTFVFVTRLRLRLRFGWTLFTLRLPRWFVARTIYPGSFAFCYGCCYRLVMRCGYTVVLAPVRLVYRTGPRLRVRCLRCYALPLPVCTRLRLHTVVTIFVPVTFVCRITPLVYLVGYVCTGFGLRLRLVGCLRLRLRCTLVTFYVAFVPFGFALVATLRFCVVTRLRFTVVVVRGWLFTFITFTLTYVAPFTVAVTFGWLLRLRFTFTVARTLRLHGYVSAFGYPLHYVGYPVTFVVLPG